jgi:hypothetical protein
MHSVYRLRSWVRSPQPHRGGMSVAQGKTRSRGTPPWVSQYKTNPSPGGAAQGLGHNLPKSTPQDSAITPAAAPPTTRSNTPHPTQRKISREAAKPRSSEAGTHPVSPFAPSRLRVPPSPRMTFYTERRANTERPGSSTARPMARHETVALRAVGCSRWLGVCVNSAGCHQSMYGCNWGSSCAFRPLKEAASCGAR